MPINRAKLRILHVTSFLVVLAERISTSFWRAFSWVLFFAGLWLFQIPSSFGMVVAVGTLILFLGGLVYFVYKGAHNFYWPRFSELKRRIETDSGVLHRPLSNAHDTLIYARNLFAYELWHKNKAYLRESLKRLKAAKFETLLSKRDPYALRFAALVFCLCGLVVAGHEWDTRLLRGVIPFGMPEIEKGTRLQMIVTPPDYVGNAVDLNLKGEVLNIPVGSMVKMIVDGGFFTPKLLINKKSAPFKSSENETYVAEAKITDGSHLKVRRLWMNLADVNYKVIPDLPPLVKLKAETLLTQDSHVVIPIEVRDDYGVEKLDLELSLDPKITKPPLGENLIETRSVLSPPAKDFSLSPVFDLTSHPWAGMPAQLKITVKDHLGQTARLDPISITLPERQFRHPIANHLIGLRKQLIQNPEMVTQPMAAEVENFLNYPEAFQNDLVTFLAIRTLSSRLYWSPPSVENTKDMIGFIWDIAIKIEDGDLPLAERNLRRVQNALDRALQNNASDSEIASIMHELREAMSAYLTEMQRELQKKLAEKNTDNMPVTLDPDAVQNYLDQMQQALMDGDRKTVQNMLSQLQRMMDMVSPQYAEMPKDMKMMQDIVNKLQELIQRQEVLLNLTQEKIQSLGGIQFDPNQPIDPQILLKLSQQAQPFVDTQENELEQEAIRLLLKGLITEAQTIVKKIPENLTKAEEEMRFSAESLDKNDPQTSIPHQEEALHLLKQSQEQTMEQFMQRLQQIGGTYMSNGQGMRRDPLGRPYGEKEGDGGLFPGSDVKIPNEAERQQALEILRELRRRSGQRERPELELDYYRRLLKQF